MYKSLEFCLPPNKRWKKYIVPLDKTVIDFMIKLGIEHGFNVNDYRVVHRGNELDITKPFRSYSYLPNNALIELIPKSVQKDVINDNVVQSKSKNEEFFVSLEVERSPYFKSVEKITLPITSNLSLWELLTNKMLIQNNLLFNSFAQELLNYDEVSSSFIPQIALMDNNDKTYQGKACLTTTLINNLMKNNTSTLKLKFKFLPKTLTSFSNFGGTSLDNSSTHSKFYETPFRNNQDDKIETHQIKKAKLIFQNSEKLLNAECAPLAQVPTPSNFHEGPSSMFAREIETMLSQISINANNTINRDAIFFITDSHNVSTITLTLKNYQDLNEDFFVPTDQEVKYMMSDLIKRRKQLEEAPLQTKEMMQYEKLKKMIKYPKTLIRLHIPSSNPLIKLGDQERLYLQATFHTTEPLCHLYNFIRENLFAGNRNQPNIELFTAPPKHLLPDSKELTLFDENLYPNALIHVGMDETHKQGKLSMDQISKIPEQSAIEAERYLTQFLKEIRDFHI